MTAGQVGSRLLTDVVIRAEIDRLEREALQKVQAELDATNALTSRWRHLASPGVTWRHLARDDASLTRGCAALALLTRP